VPHPARRSLGVVGGLAIGLASLGCPDARVLLGWNTTGGGSEIEAGSSEIEARSSEPDASSSESDAGGFEPPDASPDAPEEGMPEPPSCQGTGAGLDNCGAAAESCCTSLPVAGGSYYRSFQNTGNGPTDEAAPATVSPFRLDKYLVTVGRFRQFVAAWDAGWRPPAGSGKHSDVNGGAGLINASGVGYEPGWLASDDGNIVPTDAALECEGTLVPDLAAGSHYWTWTPSAGSQENLPINCVNWYEAYAFCIFDGGFLPSEAEFEYAAVGGSAQSEYPWGTTGPGTLSEYAIYMCYFPNGSGTCSGVQNIAPVGTATRGIGLWGQMDLAGTLWEWTLDWYVSPYVGGTCVNCANLTAGTERSTQGGNFDTGYSNFSPARHPNAPADTGAYAYGVRCARSAL
jgi:formylglycine-generating enzyme required for sulfatase activity